MTSRRRGRRGFTLIEMMMVIMILSALMSMAVPRWGESVERSKKEQCSAVRHSIEIAEAHYVSQTTAASAAIADLHEQGYLEKMPTCSSGGVYVWSSPPGLSNDRYIVCSIHGSGGAR
jgi:prepilin-type N-terminal cleavage/methylation domain-containing protein